MAQIEEHYRHVFNDVIRLQAQQEVSKFQNTVINESLSGNKQFFDNLGEVVLREKTSRNEPFVYDEIARERRMISPVEFAYAELFDRGDRTRLDTAILPSSNFMVAIGLAVERRKDDTIIDAFDATATGGQEGGSTFPFLSTQDIAFGAASTGLTMFKIIRAAQILNDADVAEDDRFWAYAPLQLQDLLEISSGLIPSNIDFNTVRMLVDGKIDTWMGFKWVPSTRLGGTPSANPNFNYAYHRTSMIFGIDMDSIEVTVDRIPERHDSMQVATYITLAAVRQFDNKIVRIDNDY